MQTVTVELVSPYTGNGETQHFSNEGEERTYCGRKRYGWMILRKADLTKDVDSAYTCKRCIAAMF